MTNINFAVLMVTKRITEIQFNSPTEDYNAKPNDKTKGNENNADERGHVEAQSPLAVSLGPLQVSNHLHVSCLRQGEQKERLTSEFYRRSKAV